jgi:hypothetical protein
MIPPVTVVTIACNNNNVGALSQSQLNEIFQRPPSRLAKFINKCILIAFKFL